MSLLKVNCLASLLPKGYTMILESALSYYDLCTFGDHYITVLNNKIDKKLITRWYHFIPNPRFGNKDIVAFDKDPKFFITTPERTICEMIACDRRDDFIIQALQNYVIFKDNPSYDKDLLFSKAREYGIHDKLIQYLEWAEEDLEDMC